MRQKYLLKVNDDVCHTNLLKPVRKSLNDRFHKINKPENILTGKNFCSKKWSENISRSSSLVHSANLCAKKFPLKKTKLKTISTLTSPFIT